MGSAQAAGPRPPKQIPETDRYYFLEDAIPKYGNLVPRDIATREIFNVCTYEGLSVEPDRMCVYLDVTQIPRKILDRNWAASSTSTRSSRASIRANCR